MGQVRKIKVGVITLAIGFIVIGILWTLDNIYPIPWISTAVNFWPVILVLFGLELIITKTLYEGRDGVSVTIDVGIILLLVFIILIMGGISFINNVLPIWGIYF